MNDHIKDTQWCWIHVKEERCGDQVHVRPVFQYTHMEQWAWLALKTKVSSTGRKRTGSLRLVARTFHKFSEECKSVLWNRRGDGQQQMTRRKSSLQRQNKDLVFLLSFVFAMRNSNQTLWDRHIIAAFLPVFQQNYTNISRKIFLNLILWEFWMCH